MSLVIRSNIPAMNAHRNLGSSQTQLNGALQKLSSGYRINSGKDAPADLVISEQLRSQFTGLKRAVRNTTEANNVLSIAEGALNEMNNILKKMKSLAIHAASDGVTSPEQVEADQAELDSGIKTLQRIAETTKYSDQMLLNGNKELTYSVHTNIVGYQNNTLVDQELSDIKQIAKHNSPINIGFTGSGNAARTTNVGDADFTKQAMKAYLEVDTVQGSLSQVDPDTGKLLQTQKFILTGTKGSKAFSFAAGTEMSKVVAEIQNFSGSTGIDASLTFNSAQAIQRAGATFAGLANADNSGDKLGVEVVNGDTDVVIYDNFRDTVPGSANTGTREVKIDSIAAAPTFNGADVVYGQQTDGLGRMFIKITGADTYEVYKDESMSAESLIGSGSSNTVVTARNNSGLDGLNIDLASNGKYGDVAVISMGGISLISDSTTGANSVSALGVMAGTTAATSANSFVMGGNSLASGVQLGKNTDADGQIHFKVEVDAAGLATVYAYNDVSMSADSLVAQSEVGVDLSTGGEGVILNSVWNDEHTANTGLGLRLEISGGGFTGEGIHTGSIKFLNLGARISSNDYGSDSFIQVQQQSGGLFTYYDRPDNAGSATLVESGKTYRQNGQDATVNVNGSQVKTRGLDLNISTTDVQAKIKLNAGRSGTTTIAQAGYNEGSVFTKNLALTVGTLAGSTNPNLADITGLLNNAGHVTNESITGFNGGMRLQLGESSGDQDRTVVSLQNMAVSNLGRIKHTAVFDTGTGVIETRMLSLDDIQSGKIASLSQDPTLAMNIIEQATNDVSNLRAHIGAVQANLLETNKNNLEVAVEKITDTESAIRNTDMAAEMTEFTSAQVMQNAGINMLAQANSGTQSVLSLLG